MSFAATTRAVFGIPASRNHLPYDLPGAVSMPIASRRTNVARSAVIRPWALESADATDLNIVILNFSEHK